MAIATTTTAVDVSASFSVFRDWLGSACGVVRRFLLNDPKRQGGQGSAAEMDQSGKVHPSRLLASARQEITAVEWKPSSR